MANLDPLSDFQAIIGVLKKCENKEQLLKILNYYFAGAIDSKNDAGKKLLARRAAFATLIREEKLWPE